VTVYCRNAQADLCLSSNIPPIAIATVTPTIAYVGENISFSSTASYDPDGTIVSYLWDFGDGNTSNEPNPVHSYSEPGNYTVTLTVIDDKGASNSTSVLVEVKPAVPDFWIDKIKPVQVVWDSDINSDGRIDLVAEKSTMVRVEVGMKNYERDKQQIVKVLLNFDSTSYTESRTIEELEENKRVEFYVASPSTVGDQAITAKVDPENEIEESDETNNEKSIEITVKDTNSLYLAYLPVDRPVTYFGYGPIDMAEYSTTVAQSGKFIKATYPIAESEFTNEGKDNKYYGSPVPILGMLSDTISIWLWGELLTGTKANRVVGTVPDDYFGYHQSELAIGITFPGMHAGLVENGYWTVATHEIGHTYGLQDEYNINPPGNTANGFWVSERREISGGICFMGYAPSKNSFNYDSRPVWIDNEDYASLFRQFRVRSSDPAVLLINGIIFKNGTVQLGKLYMVENGAVGYITPGNYSIQILDFNAQVLVNIPFYTAFEMYIDPIGVVETDFAGFAFTIPYPKNASKVLLQYSNTTLAEFNPNIKLLHDAIDSIPDYGFTRNPEQRRKALHNKISEVEIKIEEGKIKDAKNKLEHDIKDKLEKWLVDDYLKENPEQLSKDEVIGLVQAIIDRLRSYE
jgi:PKD repeat protein